MQHDIQSTRLLARVDKIAKQRIEMRRFFAQRRGQAGARADVLLQLADQLAHGHVLEAFGDDLKGLQQRDARFDQRGQLAGKQ